MNVVVPFPEQPDRRPPAVKRPEGARPVLVMTELRASDAEALSTYLQSPAVIPTTRLASGLLYSWTTQDRADPVTFVLLQSWESLTQYRAYLAWRDATGALDTLMAQLIEPPKITFLDAIDDTTLPCQAPRG